jgi:hypothetical protein
MRLATTAAGPLSLDDTFRVAEVFAKSGFFADSREAAQCVVRILAGAELGFPPMASMQGVYIVKGKVSLASNLIAAAIQRSGRYSYRVRQLDDTTCILDFYEGDLQRAQNKIGTSEFSIQDAQKAGLQSGENWKHYPRNMLFARALTNGARWYTPAVFNGPIYSPEELGAEVDEDGRPLVVEAPKPAAPGAREKAAASASDGASAASNGSTEPAPRLTLRQRYDVLLDKARAAKVDVTAWQVKDGDDLRKKGLELVAEVERVQAKKAKAEAEPEDGGEAEPEPEPVEAAF